jgi:hypothetical protein
LQVGPSQEFLQTTSRCCLNPRRVLRYTNPFPMPPFFHKSQLKKAAAHAYRVPCMVRHVVRVVRPLYDYVHTRCCRRGCRANVGRFALTATCHCFTT